MKRIAGYIVSSLLVLLGSCSQSISDNEARRDNFRSYQAISPSVRTQEENVFLGRPSQIDIIGDWLVIADEYDGYLTTWVSKDLQTIKRMIPKGLGPGEFFGIIDFFPSADEKHVVINHRDANHFLIYQTADVVNGRLNNPIRIDSIITKGINTVPFGNNYVIAEAKSDMKLFTLVNNKGEEKARFGDYPGAISNGFNASNDYLWMLIQTLITSNSEKNIVVGAGYMSDLLCFYHVDEVGHATLINQYRTYDTDLNVKSSEYGASAQYNENTMDAYRTLYPTKNYLFALYRGYLMKDRKDNPHSYIQVFDWDGNFIKGYKLEIRLTGIAVDEEKGIAYGLIGGENPAICTFQLEGLN